MEFCEECQVRRGKDVPATYDEYRDPWPLCADCRQNEAEASYGRMCEDYYGGSGPVTLQEQYDAAAKQKRELR